MTGRAVDETSDSIVVRNDLGELSRVAEWVRAWAQRNDVPSSAADRLDVCSAELVTNVLTYAYSDDSEHQIALRLDRQGDDLRLQVEDDGFAFDPLQVTPPPRVARIEDATVGGIGIQLVRGLSDGQRYRRLGNRNSLTLTFRLNRE